MLSKEEQNREQGIADVNPEFKESQHTKGKLIHTKNALNVRQIMIQLDSTRGYFPLATINDFDGSNSSANAKRICRCVNNFDDLLEACEIGLSISMAMMIKLDTAEFDDKIRKIQQAINQAKKGE